MRASSGAVEAWAQQWGVSAPVNRMDAVVVLPLQPPPGELPLRVATVEEPEVPLPVHHDGAGRLHVRVPGVLLASSPRTLWASWSAAPGWAASPTLPGVPDVADDYAQSTWADAWDFNEGDQDHITSWGDSDADVGDPRVEGGELVIPVTGNWPNLTFGSMWASDGNNIDVDTGLYSTLRLRVRQTAATSTWRVYVTDLNGEYRGVTFAVNGPDPQTITVDMKETYADFWDGRTLRALRIDPGIMVPGNTVWVDWISLTRSDAAAHPGAMLSPPMRAVRSQAAALTLTAPAQVEAGQDVSVHLEVRRGANEQMEGVPLVVEARSVGGQVVRTTALSQCGGVDVTTRALTSAGPAQRRVGVAQDNGEPGGPQQTQAFTVVPAALHHFHLVADRPFVDVDSPTVGLAVHAQDEFGNDRPVEVGAPQWTLGGGAAIPSGALAGTPARVNVTVSPTPRTRHDIMLEDGAGHQGNTRVTTLELRTNNVHTNAVGKLVTKDDQLFLPLGGLYANWPFSAPDVDGDLVRLLDLFPCGVTGDNPYPWGFPWPTQVEQQVQEFLQQCEIHGLTALRLMLRNMDLVGKADAAQLQAVLHFMDLAYARGIHFDVTLLEGYNYPPYSNLDILNKIALPQYTPAELAALPPHRARFLVEKRILQSTNLRYTDPDAIQCQKDYLDDVIPYLSGHPAVFTYEIENEMQFAPLSFVQQMAQHLRTIDAGTPILGNPYNFEWPVPWQWRGAPVDLFSFHPYTNGLPTADYGTVAFLSAKWAASSGISAFPGEGGINQGRYENYVAPPYAARGIRDQTWFALTAGGSGAFMWTAFHQLEMQQFHGVILALSTLNGLDLRSLQRQTPRTALVMPPNATANTRAYVLAHALLGRGVDFDTVPATHAGAYAVHVDAATAEPTTLVVDSELMVPSAGYQLSYLSSANAQQVLVYLRNVAGGIVGACANPTCYVRQPASAAAEISVLDGKTWSTVKAFDLDAAAEVPVTRTRDGDLLVVGGNTTHDYVLGLW